MVLEGTSSGSGCRVGRDTLKECNHRKRLCIQCLVTNGAGCVTKFHAVGSERMHPTTAGQPMNMKIDIPLVASHQKRSLGAFVHESQTGTFQDTNFLGIAHHQWIFSASIIRPVLIRIEDATKR